MISVFDPVAPAALDHHLASADDRFGRFVASDRDVSRKEMWEALVSRSSGHARALWMYPPCWTRRDAHNGTQEAEPPLLGELRNALTPDDTGRREDAVLSFPEDERTFCIFVVQPETYATVKWESVSTRRSVVM